MVLKENSLVLRDGLLLDRGTILRRAQTHITVTPLEHVPKKLRDFLALCASPIVCSSGSLKVIGRERAGGRRRSMQIFIAAGSPVSANSTQHRVSCSTSPSRIRMSYNKYLLIHDIYNHVATMLRWG